MRFWVLGSGTLLPDPRRGSPGYWLRVENHEILLDCGAGTLRTLARLGLPWDRVSHLFVSHFHTDHVGEIPSLLFALKHGIRGTRSLPLWILGPRGTLRHFHLLEEAYGPHILDPGFHLEIVELEDGEGWEDPSGDFRLRSRGTLHTEASLALRVESGSLCVGYTGDTGPDPSLGTFFRGCQLLVAECSLFEDQEPGLHLSPGTLRKIAEPARPDLLLTVHTYPPLDPEAVPDLLEREGYTGRVQPGRDGMCVILDETGPRVEDEGGV